MEKEKLTNENLRKKFISQFDLVNYAIRLAENMIKTGRGPRVKIEIQNPAVQILAEISENKDRFDEIIEVIPEKKEFATNHDGQHSKGFSSKESSGKFSERKKQRILS